MEAIASIGARRRFIEALSPLFGRPLEADPVCPYTALLCNLVYFFRIHYDLFFNQVLCRRATVLCASGAFTFLVCSRIVYLHFM